MGGRVCVSVVQAAVEQVIEAVCLGVSRQGRGRHIFPRPGVWVWEEGVYLICQQTSQEGPGPGSKRSHSDIREEIQVWGAFKKSVYVFASKHQVGAASEQDTHGVSERAQDPGRSIRQRVCVSISEIRDHVSLCEPRAYVCLFHQ